MAICYIQHNIKHNFLTLNKLRVSSDTKKDFVAKESCSLCQLKLSKTNKTNQNDQQIIIESDYSHKLRWYNITLQEKGFHHTNDALDTSNIILNTLLYGEIIRL
ncbi:hypothetical protein H8356DRAFT_1336012 [Neocallimastix lanati (nom. inval.)]|nr:hypothetical protein H8356DRAFT_1336012 [Neocallimastix sp. JGI-2020a]